MRTARPHWAIPLTIVATFVAILGGTLPAMALFDPADPGGPTAAAAQVAAGIGVTAVAIVLVLLWRRFLLRRPWSGVALPWKPSALPQALLGTAVAVAAVQLALAASVAVGAARWGSWSVYGGDPGTIWLTVLVIFSVSVLLQGFPEELLWRGNLHDLLSTSLSPRLVLMLTSVFFALLHILSMSDAEGAGEQALYVVMALALGFAAGAARLRTGATWMAVGIHSGLHIGIRSVPFEPTNYAVWLLLLTGALTLTGVLLLALPRRRGATRVNGLRSLVRRLPGRQAGPRR